MTTSSVNVKRKKIKLSNKTSLGSKHNTTNTKTSYKNHILAGDGVKYMYVNVLEIKTLHTYMHTSTYEILLRLLWH